MNKQGKAFQVCRFCTPHHIYNCRTCFGYGLDSAGVPVADANIYTVQGGQTCSECGSDIRGYVEHDPLTTVMAAAQGTTA